MDVRTLVGRRAPRARSLRGAVLAAALTGGLALPLLPSPASADTPPPATAAQAEAAVAAAAQQLTAIGAQVQDAQLTVTAEQQAAAAAAAKAKAAESAVAAYGPQLRALAQAGLPGGDQSRIAAFLTSDSASDAVEQLSTLEMVASRTESLISDVAHAADAARAARAAADKAAATATGSLTALQGQQQQLKDRITAYKADYARLSATEQAAVTTAVAGPRLSAPSSSQLASMAPSAAIAKVLRAALDQQGKPYVWGDTGPDGFDCSGLTLFAYATVGITLPHSSSAQYSLGTPVSRADLQPGDLVFFYHPISHVAIYVGGGEMVEARTYGVPVSVSSVDRDGYVGARRIIPLP